ncbi:TetR/AcrR family transcriptional regulator [Amphibacillus cookii]|uniref:TetR/AcrR family transcriptional regulator n=1 Tax=Amphibacillus cookii TaxID=767787 RepID=UPI00195D51FA|nr:TetR/AcrR family transcriptional regulator [Amphibacillus cookii]MBM7541946.1 AcrR family transcriptional regulator [Amphibacillus cookii]
MTEYQSMFKGNKTKDRILAASMEIIAKEGIEGLSAKKIADLSGISKSTLFHHFGSIDEVLNIVFEYTITYLIKPVQSDQSTNLEGFLLSLGESIYTLTEEEKIAYLVLLNFYITCLHNEKYRSYLLKAKNEMTEAIASQLTNYSSQNKDRLLQISEIIMMTLDGYAIHFLLQPGRGAFKEIWALHVSGWLTLLK